MGSHSTLYGFNGFNAEFSFRFLWPKQWHILLPFICIIIVIIHNSNYGCHAQRTWLNSIPFQPPWFVNVALIHVWFQLSVCNGRRRHRHRLNIMLLRFVNFMVDECIEWTYSVMFHVFDMPDLGPFRLPCFNTYTMCVVDVVCVFDLINIADTNTIILCNKWWLLAGKVNNLFFIPSQPTKY